MKAQTAFVFPGQGSQKVGMGLELYQTYAEAKATFLEADETLGRSISQICFEGPISLLTQTENTQLAIFATSVAALRVAQQQEFTATVVAGHSLGEYSALVASGVLSFVDGLLLVGHRSRLMANAGQQAPGSMAAILDLEVDLLQQICQQVVSQKRTGNSTDAGVVQIANYNCPGQLIISGSAEAVKQVTGEAKSAGAKRAILLKVSGAFHSSLMQPAQEKFANLITEFQFEDPKIDLVANVTGDFVTAGDEVQHLLTEQITRPVLWEQSMRSIYNRGIHNFVEVGTGNTLAGLIGRTFNDTTCTNIASLLN
ncbi:MAG: ACP S-malonyltransferase [Candidatus Poribacteria bacterium]|jgi:[acyl-carrier-protein] S-malonyltransferase|nr:ACP S-malonyltransferase [Candidatus Poribacteria bacterium]MDP6747110.1 ACP S-malonyltransferase [Candidatus Poribacteria bacterium]MDP6996417.1 ACP S-malonyltransferase [Candidatus Poribacteria bacterium]